MLIPLNILTIQFVISAWQCHGLWLILKSAESKEETLALFQTRKVWHTAPTPGVINSIEICKIHVVECDLAYV